MDQEKKAKLEKLKKLQKINQQHSNHNQVHPNSQVSSHHKLPSVGNQSKVKREPKMPLTGQKRKTEKKKEILNQKSNNDFTKMAKKKPKMIKGNALYCLPQHTDTACIIQVKAYLQSEEFRLKFCRESVTSRTGRF